MHTLTANQVCRLAGIDQKTLDRWCNSDFSTPTMNGQGQGNHRAFTLMDAVAIAHGAQWRDEGCPYPWVAEVVRFVANLSEERMTRAFELGLKMVLPLPAHLGQSQLAPMDDEPPVGVSIETHEALDLSRTYARVLREVTNRAPAPARGRKPVMNKN